MISTENVKTTFSLLSGENDTTLYLPIILGSINEVSAKLKTGADETDQRIINLCAALSNLRYTQATASRDKLTHTLAGSVTQNRNGSEKLKLALSMFCSMLKNCSDLLEDTSFYFISAKG